jgi:phage protein U
MFASLGDIQFDILPAIKRLSGSSRADFIEHAVIEGKPRLQYVGDALDTLRLRIRFHASFGRPETNIKRIKDAFLKHEAMPVIFGNSIYRGMFVIEEMEDEAAAAFADGSLICADLEILLKEWVQDTTVTTKRTRKVKTTSSVKKQSSKVTPTPWAGTPKEQVPLSAATRQE